MSETAEAGVDQNLLTVAIEDIRTRTHSYLDAHAYVPNSGEEA